MNNRTPTKITIQYRAVPYLPNQVRITRHYGPGIPREYRCPLAGPNGIPYVSPTPAMADAEVARFRDGCAAAWPGVPVVILPHKITR